MNNKPCFELHDHKDEDWSKQQIIHNSEIASPDIVSMVLEGGHSILTGRTPFLRQISLDCPLAYSNSQLKELSLLLLYSP